MLCDACDTSPCEIVVKFDTTSQNGFSANELDATKIITIHSTKAADTSVINKESLISRNNTYILYLEDVDAFRILQKDSLFDIVISDFTFEKVDVEEGGCCNCGDYSVLKSFDVNGQTIGERSFIISKK
ncbi:MAG: hypothetical protein ACXWDO_10380 [Bacteroidia bacterium]